MKGIIPTIAAALAFVSVLALVFHSHGFESQARRACFTAVAHHVYTPQLFGQCLADYGSAGRCTEDMACWNCSTMGNEVCGRTGR